MSAHIQIVSRETICMCNYQHPIITPARRPNTLKPSHISMSSYNKSFHVRDTITYHTTIQRRWPIHIPQTTLILGVYTHPTSSSLPNHCACSGTSTTTCEHNINLHSLMSDTYPIITPTYPIFTHTTHAVIIIFRSTTPHTQHILVQPNDYRSWLPASTPIVTDTPTHTNRAYTRHYFHQTIVIH
jgi:hypothetical protein